MQLRISVFLIGLIGFFPPNASAAEVCPALPANSGVSWQIDQGPDFDVCHAIRSSDKKELFGIYLGNHPWFKPDSSARQIKGNVGGHAVSWQFHRSSDKDGIVWETLVTLPSVYPGIPELAHAWLPALGRPDVVHSLNLLARLHFQPLNSGP